MDRLHPVPARIRTGAFPCPRAPRVSLACGPARWAAPRCHESYFNVRGTEVQAGAASLVSLPGYGPLPAAARMVLQKIQNVTFEPFQLVPLFTVGVGCTIGASILYSWAPDTPAACSGGGSAYEKVPVEMEDRRN